MLFSSRYTKKSSISKGEERRQRNKRWRTNLNVRNLSHIQKEVVPALLGRRGSA